MQESAIPSKFSRVSDKNTINQTYYQVGGVLAVGSPSYVVRHADEQLLQGLRAGEFCYVLSSRQMGKSSLLLRTMERLLSEGFCCALIDTAVIASQSVNPDDWYRGVINYLIRELNLDFDLRQWWSDNSLLSPVQKFEAFLQRILPAEISEKLVIFVDKIESVSNLKFSVSDFFSVLDHYSGQQSKNESKGIIFAVFGIAHPYELTQDKNTSLFNRGFNIDLKGFSLEEAIETLSPGLRKKAANPAGVVKEVLAWTAGQPFLTQKVCFLIEHSSAFIPDGSESYYVEALIRREIIDNWERNDIPPHFQKICDRLFNSGKNPFNILVFYKEILQLGGLKANDTQEEIELRLLGMVVKDSGNSRIFNQIYQEVFNLNWVETLLKANTETTQIVSCSEDNSTIKTTTKVSSNFKNNHRKKLVIKSGLILIGLVVILFAVPFINSVYMLRKANNLVKNGNYRKAIIVYDKILDIYPNSSKVWFLRAFPLSKMGRFQDMWQSCDRAISINHSFVKAWNCRGLANSALKRYQQSINDYDQALKISPDLYPALNNKAESLIKLNQPKEAMIALDKAILANPKYNFAWNNKGNILFKMGKYMEALSAYDKALSIDKTYPYAWNGRGNVNRALKRYGTALSDYDRAFLYKPDFDEALYNKSLVLLDLKQDQDAIETLEKTIEVNPRHLQAIHKLEEIRHGK